MCRLVDWAVERVRKREQHKLAAYSCMLKQNRRVLMKHPDHLTEAEHIKLCEILRISEDLRKAYALKLSFRKIFSTYGKQGIAAHLTHWLDVNVNIRMYNFDDVQCTVIPSVAYGFVTGMNLQLC